MIQKSLISSYIYGNNFYIYVEILKIEMSLLQTHGGFSIFSLLWPRTGSLWAWSSTVVILLENIQVPVEKWLSLMRCLTQKPSEIFLIINRSRVHRWLGPKSRTNQSTFTFLRPRYIYLENAFITTPARSLKKR